MNKPQILIVEDDNAVANLISATLETQDYAYKRAATGAVAVMEALSCKPDVVLLDLGLPDMDGVEIIKKIRSWSNMPIIVVSARSEDFDKVSALDAGADDYLTKPFSVDELLARLRVALRRVRYDALTSERCYKKAYHHRKAVDMILNGECGAFNPILLECFVEIEGDLALELEEKHVSRPKA